MKNIHMKYSYRNKGYFLSAVVIVLSLFIFSCEDQNYLHEKYLKEGETVYIGKVDSMIAFPGNYRIKFRWRVGNDPRTTKTVIYWDERENSVEVPLNAVADSTGRLWDETIIENMEENDYVFEFEMQDEQGNISMSREITASVLGDLYSENIRKRGVEGIAKLETAEMEIQWNKVSNKELIYSVVEYEHDGNIIKQQVPNEDNSSYVGGLSTGDTIYIYSCYLPENGLDTFATAKVAYVMPKFQREISKAGFEALVEPGDNTSVNNGRPLSAVFDGGTRSGGSDGTILHTVDYTNATGSAIEFKFPNKFTIDMGKLATLYQFKIWPRTDNSPFTGHSARFIEVWAVDELKTQDDFATEADYQTYYTTTYVEQKDPLNYLSKDEFYTDILSNTNSKAENFVEAAPMAGIYNWQEDWHKLGDFEIEKPSGYAYGSKNDADQSAWDAGFTFNLNEIGEKVRYIRILVKFPNWQNTNCVNIGEISFFGDDL
ncbi:DUF4998 domain-containing protein [Maribellus sp. YY47]|uniref:DUF4998 domain-containing protein n=1 Tax=Maribellus sp. YY47 TaxID=2929486 RepID=UPI002000ACFF|nr:DUF4998 domain-containing protein [Maribellus sp. YY47]MCK3683619.1 hypothetical protein [Maribellus sp. YY47]